jgi:hypothetical protein
MSRPVAWAWGSLRHRDTASFRSRPAVRWSRCSLTFHLGRCPSMSCIPARANWRRACACSSTGWPSGFANGTSHRTRAFCPAIPTRRGSRRQSPAHPRCRLLGQRFLDFRARHRADRCFPHSMVRESELRDAVWNAGDFENAVWTIPIPLAGECIRRQQDRAGRSRPLADSRRDRSPGGRLLRSYSDG